MTRTDSNYDVNANTKLYLKLNGDSNDSSGNGYNGTDTNISYVAGKFGNCASFNGSSSKIAISDNDDIELGTNYTFSCWIYLDGVGSNNPMIMDKARGQSNGPRINVLSSGSNVVWTNSAGASYNVKSTFGLSTGIWYNIICTKSGSTANLYINGIYNAQKTNWSGTYTNSATMYIGGVTAANSWHDGLIDEVIIENTARTDKQVLDYYNKSQTKYLGEYLGAGPSVTKGLYHLNGNSNDSSGNGNNGTDTSISYVAGKFGNCGSFDGTNSKIILSNYNSNETTATLSARVNYTVAVNRGTVVYGQNTSGNQIWEISEEDGSTSGKIGVGFRGNSGSTFKQVLSQSAMNDGLWHHICGTYNNGTIILYIDGKYIGTDTCSNGTIFSNNNQCNMGFNKSTDTKKFNGLIDEVIIENRVWTAEQAKKYYTYAKGRFGIV